MGQDNSRLEQAFHRVSLELKRQEEENEALRQRLAHKEEKSKQAGKLKKEVCTYRVDVVVIVCVGRGTSCGR